MPSMDKAVAGGAGAADSSLAFLGEHRRALRLRRGRYRDRDRLLGSLGVLVA